MFDGRWASVTVFINGTGCLPGPGFPLLTTSDCLAYIYRIFSHVFMLWCLTFHFPHSIYVNGVLMLYHTSITLQ